MAECWWVEHDGTKCTKEGTIKDPEVPPGLFTKGDPVHCPEHHKALMRRRDANEDSWARMAGYRR